MNACPSHPLFPISICCPSLARSSTSPMSPTPAHSHVAHPRVLPRVPRALLPWPQKRPSPPLCVGGAGLNECMSLTRAPSMSPLARYSHVAHQILSLTRAPPPPMSLARSSHVAHPRVLPRVPRPLLPWPQKRSKPPLCVGGPGLNECMSLPALLPCPSPAPPMSLTLASSPVSLARSSHGRKKNINPGLCPATPLSFRG